MNLPNNYRIPRLSLAAVLLMTLSLGLTADVKKPSVAPPKAPPKVSAKPPAKPAAAARPAAPGAKPAAAGTAARPGTAGTAARPATAGTRPGAPGTAARPNSPAAHTVPTRTVAGRNGTRAEVGPRGDVRTIHRGNMTIARGPGGARRAEIRRADGSRLVAERRGGYVEHGYRYGGRDYYRRNYYYNGGYYPRYYNAYYYNGYPVNVYAPGYYYAPAFYGYAYAPWGAPVNYAWGWGGNPWYGYYGGYFSPYAVYNSPALWLTDYLVAQSLQQAYLDHAAAVAQANAQAGAEAAAAAPAPMTPEVKDAISAEVRRQISLENAERQSATTTAPDPASSSIARILSDNTAHTFVADTGLNVMSGGQECAVTEGDVLQVSTAPAAGATTVNAVILASKGQDCAKGAVVEVEFAALQDMQNHMRATVDAGLGELQKKQGQGGLPALPPSAAAPPVQSAMAAAAPAPDPTEAAEVTKQVQDANGAEQDALAAAAAPAGPGPNAATQMASPAAAPTATPALGQTPDQVVAAMGAQPKTKFTVGTKTTYVYPDVKIIFVGGKVTDIQ